MRRRTQLAIRLALAILLLAGAAAGMALRALQFHAPQDARNWPATPIAPVADLLNWHSVGGDPGGAKFSPLAQITPGNAGRLKVAWVYRTGEATRHADVLALSKFEATPIIADRKLVLCSPFNRVSSLDPQTGREIWVFDPALDTSVHPANDFNCRGLARWVDAAAPPGTPCAERVFMASNDRRLFAIDAHDGHLCPGFGHDGQLTVIPDSETHAPWEVQIVAAPIVVNGVVIVGSSVADNQWADAASGRVHAYDARTGAERWSFDPVPGAHGKTGGANVWSSFSADPERDLVFLPTTSPSPDFFGGLRQGDESLANAIVALRASTGQRVWSFQAVHHDLWDYDLPSAPSLFTLHRGNASIPALAFATKQGFVFVLDRQTGTPLYPVTERPVPASDVPGERASPTQPFSSLPPIAPQGFDASASFGPLGIGAGECRAKMAQARSEGLFTPPSLRGTIFAPTSGGGANWGGVAIDPRSNRLVVNTLSAVEIIKLIPRAEADRVMDGKRVAEGAAPMRGTPYAVQRGAVLSSLGMPCNPPPWGLLNAIDLDTGQLGWRKTLGTTAKLAPLGIALPWGTPNIGGPLITGGGLIFIAATLDDRLRAFDLRSGEEIWAASLPASAQSTPMSYAIGGRQYIVLAAGGHSVVPTARGDFVVAFSLPQ